jgi:transcriptional regulator with XRE-family HTH domain
MNLEDWLQLIGEHVRELRGNVNQEDFAARCGISRAMLSIVENGKRSYGVRVLAQILAKGQANADWFSRLVSARSLAEQRLFVGLKEILESKDENAKTLTRLTIQNAHSSVTSSGGGHPSRHRSR